MLGRRNDPGAKSPDPARQQQQHALRELHTEMRGADDAKIRQIVDLLEKAPDNQALHAVLDPLRPRLATLRPVRPLRFTRLLFIPFADLLVPARSWKPGQATIPRNILKSVGSTVSTAMGRDAAAIEALIAGHDTTSTEIITRAGKLLWGPAGEILALAPPPDKWEETGLPVSAYAPLARGMATVLRRAVAVRFLLREAELGVLQPNEQTITEIVLSMTAEPAEGRVLVLKLILAEFPHAAALLRRLTELSRTPAERAMLQGAIERGVDDVLTDMENEAGLTSGLRDDPLSEVGMQAQRIAILLQDLGNEPDAARHRSRLRGIREQTDGLCRDRFAAGMKDGLVSPLAEASAPVDAAGQKQLENCARDLRCVETAGRKLGGASAYDAMLAKAGEAVGAAVDSGALSRVRAVRLVEILSGPEEAERMLKKAVKK